MDHQPDPELMDQHDPELEVVEEEFVEEFRNK